MATDSVLLMLASVIPFYEAYKIHRDYQNVLKIRIPPKEIYDKVILPTIRRYRRLLPIYFVGGLALFISGATTLFLVIGRKLGQERRNRKKEGN